MPGGVLISRDISIFRNGKLLGTVSAKIFDTPDGNHGALWKNRVFPCKSLTPDEPWDIDSRDAGQIDISSKYFKIKECEECEHGAVREGDRSKPDPGHQLTGELTRWAPRGYSLISDLKLLVLEVMQEEPDCNPDGNGVSTAIIESRAGLELHLPSHNSSLTWSVLTAMEKDGMVLSVPGSQAAWRLTPQDPDRGPEQNHDPTCEGSIPDTREKFRELITECPNCRGSVMEFDKFCSACSNPL
jgi:hypothetical protein